MTTSQREKIKAAGALGIKREVTIRAERIDNSTPTSESLHDFKIIFTFKYMDKARLLTRI